MEHAGKDVNGPAVRASAAATDVSAFGVEHAQACRQGGVADEIKQQVVALGRLSKVFAGVVDYVVGANGADEFDVSGAAHSGDAGAKQFCNLDSECPYASGRAVDEDLLASLNSAFIAQALQCRNAGDGHGCSLLPGDILRLQSQLRLESTCVFGERAGRCAEDLIARFEACHIAAGRFYNSGYVRADPPGFWRANSGEQAHERRLAPDKVPIVGVYRGCANLDEDLVVGGCGLFDLLILQHVRRTVVVVDDCFHRLHSVLLRSTEWHGSKFPRSLGSV